MDTRELKRRLAIEGLRYGDLAQALGLSKNTVQNRISGRSEWTAREVAVMADIFSVTLEDAYAMLVEKSGG